VTRESCSIRRTRQDAALPRKGPTDRPTDGLDLWRSIFGRKSPKPPFLGGIRETFAQAPSLSPSELVDEDRKEKGSHHR
jgi:hypothetical protein